MENIDKLKQLYNNNKYAKSLLDLFAERSNKASSTAVDRAMQLINSKGVEVSRGQVVSAMQELESLGAGRFKSGRRGKQSRMEWDVDVISLGKAAAGETIEIESLSTNVDSQEEVDEAPVQSLEHSFHIRTNFAVTFDLPQDFTASEAKRLAKFIEAIPMDLGVG